jgi:hypothetical protein
LADAARADTAAGGVEAWRLDPLGYIRERLRWEPWAGSEGHPGQVEILDAYAAALRAQLDQPGATCQNIIRIEAGHTVGKTKLASGIVSHFFDCFEPAIVYTYAPTWEQIHDLLWKEISADRRRAGLPGRVLETCEIKSDRADHFAKGRATSNVGGQGTERAQGQHGPHLLFVLDEAEGIADYVYDAVQSMTSGGLAVVLMLANPRTRYSRFHRMASGSNVVNFRLSCIYHPNVLENREIVPGAVMRRYVEQMIDDGTTQHAEQVDEHNADDHTFELPWQPGAIYRPDAEFLFRVMGVAPGNVADDVFVSPGRYEAAKNRHPSPHAPHIARLGIDVARFGKDRGNCWIRHNGAVWRAVNFAQQDTNVYATKIKQVALELKARGVTSLHIRVDGGGGFGGGVIDKLKVDQALVSAFDDFRVIEVHFNGTAHDQEAYADCASEMYGHTAEMLRWAALVNPPGALEGDLCERKYTWVAPRQDNIKKDVKKLEPKDKFRLRMQRSPDDGDGCALACADDRLWPDEPRAFDLPYDNRRRR